MQTFLTDIQFKNCAAHLDSKRLQKQRVECFQIYNAVTGIRFDSITDDIIGPAVGWTNHPAVRMWKQYPHMLLLYSWYISEECNNRGIADNRGLQFFFERRMIRHPFVVPEWWADPVSRDKIIFTHRANLVRKSPTFYGPLFPEITPVIAYTTDYKWPV